MPRALFVEARSIPAARQGLGSVSAGSRVPSDTLLTAVVMSEPGPGSDLVGMRTSALRGGDHRVGGGAKTFLTRDIQVGLVLVAHISTDPANRHAGLVPAMFEDGRPGFARHHNLAGERGGGASDRTPVRHRTVGPDLAVTSAVIVVSTAKSLGI